MAKVQFQVDGLDSNQASIFNSDVTFDGNINANSISIGGVNIAQVYATQGYVANALSSVTVDLSTAAGDGIDWNANTQQLDIANNIPVSYIQSSAPTSPTNGDIWIDTDGTALDTYTGITISDINLTGIPVAPTANTTTNTTQIATTAFVQSAISSSTPTGDSDQIVLASQIFG